MVAFTMLHPMIVKSWSKRSSQETIKYINVSTNVKLKLVTDFQPKVITSTFSAVRMHLNN